MNITWVFDEAVVHEKCASWQAQIHGHVCAMVTFYPDNEVPYTAHLRIANQFYRRVAGVKDYDEGKAVIEAALLLGLHKETS